MHVVEKVKDYHDWLNYMVGDLIGHNELHTMKRTQAMVIPQPCSKLHGTNSWPYVFELSGLAPLQTQKGVSERLKLGHAES